MLEKTETSINDIPKELMTHIQNDLECFSEIDRSCFASLSKLFHSNQDERLIRKLLDYVSRGNQIRAQKLLEFRPDLASKRATFTDCFGDTLRCSPFEYALADMDVRYMCPMMLDCLPINEEGEAIRIELDNQLNNFEKMGLTCSSSVATYTKRYFSFDPLKQALKKYIDHFDNGDWTQRRLHWCAVVGQAQLRLPAHIRQHYCDPEESFYPTPKFTKNTLIRSLKFYNSVTGVAVCWDMGLTGLGENLAIVRGSGAAWGGGSGLSPSASKYDLAAITALDDIRIKIDLPLLKQRLKSPLQKPEAISEYLYGMS